MTVASDSYPPALPRPLIGIALDWQECGSFSKRPHYALRQDYFDAVWAAGGLPVGLPLATDAADTYLDHVQAVLLPGGDYPSPSRWYGDDRGISDSHPRTLLNEKLVRLLLARDMPFLAICAGEQEMAAATGGLLFWRVKDAVPGALNHRGQTPTEPCHTVTVVEGSLLHRLTGQTQLDVNSHHNEAVRSIGEGLVITGTAPDGVIEAIEVPDKTFALGVQWHPEFGLTAADKALFTGLVEAARRHVPETGVACG